MRKGLAMPEAYAAVTQISRPDPYQIAAAGGSDALTKARRLRWTGEADVHAAGRDISLAVRSDIVPFGKIRSETWLRVTGPSTLRVLEMDGRTGWTTRDGKREPMPEAMARNEYAQFGTYALMRLVTLRDPAAETHVLPERTGGLRGLQAHYPGLPDATLWFDDTNRLAALTNTVAAPDGTGVVQQRFEFSGIIESKGVRWPKQMRILQDGSPFFELRLQSFEALAE
jgi:hypothetical protein